MTQVTVECRPSGSVHSIVVSGHSDYAQAGEDIVCAAISTLTQSLVMTLTTMYTPKPKTDIDDGRLSCQLPMYSGSVQGEVSALLRHTVFALMSLAVDHPQHISVVIDGLSCWQDIFATEDPKVVQAMLLKLQAPGGVSGRV